MPIEPNKAVCWVPTCDNCGEGYGYDEGGTAHYESREEAVQALTSVEWHVEDDLVLCGPCVENEDYPSGDSAAAIASLREKVVSRRQVDPTEGEQ